MQSALACLCIAIGENNGQQSDDTTINNWTVTMYTPKTYKDYLKIAEWQCLKIINTPKKYHLLEETPDRENIIDLASTLADVANKAYDECCIDMGKF